MIVDQVTVRMWVLVYTPALARLAEMGIMPEDLLRDAHVATISCRANRGLEEQARHAMVAQFVKRHPNCILIRRDWR